MIHDGVELLSHADKFDLIAGSLLNFLVPPNKGEVISLKKHYGCVIEATAIVFIEQIQRDIPDGEKGSLAQKQKNYTIKQIRRLRTKYRKISHKQLLKNVWKG
jgi:hypothetical protein